MASAMPVLPLVHSKMIESGRSRPRCSASRITPFARRSLMLPLGFKNSHLAWIVTLSRSKCSVAIGVLPIKSRIAVALFAFMFAILQPQFPLRFPKLFEREFKVFTRVRGRDLGPDTRLSFRDDRIGETNDIHALLQHCVCDLRRERGIAEHDGHDGMRSRQDVEAE